MLKICNCNTKHIILSCFLVFIFFSLLTGCSQNEKSTLESNPILEGDMIIIITFYPDNTREGSYYFEIGEDGKLDCYMGTRTTEEIEPVDLFFSKIEKHEQVQLSADILEHIYLHVDLLQKSYYDEGIIGDDCWFVILMHNDIIYEMNYDFGEHEALRVIIDEIIRVCPFPVDMDYW